MPALQEPLNLGDLLKYEAPNLYSRDRVTVAAGQTLPLGTVLGMVSTFRGLPAVSGSVPGGAGMAELASGIWVALLTTVAGLAVAVPVILCHTYLSARVDSEEETLNRGVDFLVREKLLQKSPRTGDPARP